MVVVMYKSLQIATHPYLVYLTWEWHELMLIEELMQSQYVAAILRVPRPR